jgi:hypothetical protein
VATEVRHFSFSRIAPHVDQRSTAAGVVEAGCQQVLYAQRALPSVIGGWAVFNSEVFANLIFGLS